ncbi:unnamed protein product [Leuciscus chuanchicus]
MKTGPTYGRKMMTGYLAAAGVHASEGHVGDVLRNIHLPYHRAPCQGARNLNPVPYNAGYVGHKVHIDQNEKNGYVWCDSCAGDRWLLQLNCWNINNACEEQPHHIHDGVWDVGPGKSGPWEGVLPYSLHAASHRHNTERPPYMQTPSTKNHTIERIWPEINNRVNYPLKVALVQLVDQEALDMEDSMSKFCASSLTCQLARLGVDCVVQAWNAHRKPAQQRRLGRYRGDMRFVERKALLHQCHCQPTLTQHNLVCSDSGPGLSVQDQRLLQPQEALRDVMETPVVAPCCRSLAGCRQNGGGSRAAALFKILHGNLE